MVTPAGEGVQEGFIMYVSAGECGEDGDSGNNAVQGKHCTSSRIDAG